MKRIKVFYWYRCLIDHDDTIKTLLDRNDLDAFMDFNESELFEYHKLQKDQYYNAYLRKTNDLLFVNVLFGVEIRSSAKSIMYRYFDYYDKNGIDIFYRNTDSILIKKRYFDEMNWFKSKESRYPKIECRFNERGAIVPQGKFSLRGDANNKNRKMKWLRKSAWSVPDLDDMHAFRWNQYELANNIWWRSIFAFSSFFLQY
jgi:hypothetical protein